MSIPGQTDFAIHGFSLFRMKNDGRLGRNYLRDIEGNRTNATLCAAGQNLRAFSGFLSHFYGYCIFRCETWGKSGIHWTLTKKRYIL